MDVSSKKPKPKRRVLHEEEFNRDGHWYRSFTVRSEVWPIIEHWAAEHGYHLVALKGKKRTYQKGKGPAWYTTIIDLKQNENEFSITAWVKVGFTARLLSLFLHARELPIDATGWKGSVVRRKAVHELNGLLERLRQAAIANSLGFHIADLDSTTRVLSALTLSTITFFVTGILTHLEASPVLAHELFLSALDPMAELAGLSILLLAIHNFLIIRRFKRTLWKAISAGLVFSSLVVMSAVLLSRISQEMSRTRYVHACFKRIKEDRCEELKARLSEFDRVWIVHKMRELEKELGVRPK